MEDKLKYKQISTKESVGKIIENIWFECDELLVTFTDKTFFFIEKEYFGYDGEGLCKATLDFKKITDEINIWSHTGKAQEFYPITRFIIDSGIVLKEDVDEFIKEKSKSIIEKNKLNELEQYKKLKAKYEGSSN